MKLKIIVSYDDTDNDKDALALGRVLAQGGSELALAYVRHDEHADKAAQALAEDQAEALLERGAKSIGAESAARHVIVNASTPDGLRELAEREGADVVVFGSEYRTARGSVRPGTSAERLLSNGPVAVAVAPAGLHERGDFEIKRIGVLADGDADAEKSAEALAGNLRAEVTRPGEAPVDLLVIGSSPESPTGRVNLSAAAGYAIETSPSAVVAIPHGAPIAAPRPALSRA